MSREIDENKNIVVVIGEWENWNRMKWNILIFDLRLKKKKTINEFVLCCLVLINFFLFKFIDFSVENIF